MNDMGTLISGGALVVSMVALTLAVISNIRGYSLHQRQLDVERRMDRLEGHPAVREGGP